MKNKTILCLLAIFMIVGSLTAVFALEANYGSFKLQYSDDDFKVTQTNDTSLVLQDDQEQIIVTSEITGNDSVNSFLSSKGFTYKESTHGETKVSGTQTGSFQYDMNSYTKSNGAAAAFFINKNNKDYTVIVIDNDVDGDDNLETSDAMSVANDIVKSIMLA